ncbi:MAG: aromatic amino acid transaminase [Acidimicrobiia bacterium]|nr:aromatic amino acid transaminase [Acidimicrobiia bacterium]
MFERYEAVPPDPILGLIERFRDDPSPDKVDLGVGVYRDESGRTPIMAAVREAARAEIESASSKAYFGQAGNPAINPVIQDLVLGEGHPATAAARALTLQTPGGSGALRVAAEMLREVDDTVRMWVPTPTWANHVPLIGAAGVQLVSYPYYDHETAAIDRDAMFEALGTAKRGDVVLVHASCHNPTGADLAAEDFRTLASIAMERGLVTLVDNAYQGFARGLDEDAAGIRILVEAGLEVLVATSFSKNFGLYRDRAGALMIAGPSSRTTSAAYSNALRLVRRMYSVPPDHGPALVARILTTHGLRGRWQSELDHMRNRLIALRRTLVDELAARGLERFGFIADQRGMFSLLGIDESQAERLTDVHHIYLPRNGRINVAGIGEDTAGYVADALADVTSSD